MAEEYHETYGDGWDIYYDQGNPYYYNTGTCNRQFRVPGNVPWPSVTADGSSHCVMDCLNFTVTGETQWEKPILSGNHISAAANDDEVEFDTRPFYRVQTIPAPEFDFDLENLDQVWQQR